MIITNVLQFTVDILKVFILTDGICKIRQKRRTFYFYLLGVILIATCSLWVNLFDHTYVFGILIVCTLAFNTTEKNKIWVYPLAYIVLSTLDVLNSLVVIRLFHLTMQEIMKFPYMYIGIDSITLIELLVLLLYFKVKRKDKFSLETGKYFLLYSMGAIAVSVYLTCAQMSLLSNLKKTYQNALLVGLLSSGIMFLAVSFLLFKKTGENEYLKREQAMNRQLLEAQIKYYELLTEKEEQIRAFRHDIKNHLYCMGILADNKQYAELQQYLRDMGQSLEMTVNKQETGNNILSAIWNDLSTTYPQVEHTWKGQIKGKLTISSYDICTIFYNLLRNAFEAAQLVDSGEVAVEVKYLRNVLYLRIRNTYTGKVKREGDRFISTKKSEEHGYGIKNARECIVKNGGTYEVHLEDKYFLTDIIIPESTDDLG